MRFSKKGHLSCLLKRNLLAPRVQVKGEEEKIEPKSEEEPMTPLTFKDVAESLPAPCNHMQRQGIGKGKGEEIQKGEHSKRGRRIFSSERKT